MRALGKMMEVLADTIQYSGYFVLLWEIINLATILTMMIIIILNKGRG